MPGGVKGRGVQAKVGEAAARVMAVGARVMVVGATVMVAGAPVVVTTVASVVPREMVGVAAGSLAKGVEVSEEVVALGAVAPEVDATVAGAKARAGAKAVSTVALRELVGLVGVAARPAAWPVGLVAEGGIIEPLK
jgi:hypothetical protein